MCSETSTCQWIPDYTSVTFRRFPINHFDAALIVQVPEPQRAVNWTTDDARVIKLQTCDGVLMAVKCLDAVSTERPHLAYTGLILI